MKYAIIISPQADLDMTNLESYIKDDLQLPDTAAKYMAGVDKTLDYLALYADLIGFNPYVQAMFGKKTRRVVYKKMSIIYVIRGNIVYVKRVIASSMIH
ncbi:hypothetical protein AGMMS49965_26500 [Bacteroidia bacterium]|nr:hypothetical protein AGMMS49965_26500 [Bacteroidia bacterium]